jgi:hypothetical protein
MAKVFVSPTRHLQLRKKDNRMSWSWNTEQIRLVQCRPIALVESEWVLHIGGRIFKEQNGKSKLGNELRLMLLQR